MSAFLTPKDQRGQEPVKDIGLEATVGPPPVVAGARLELTIAQRGQAGALGLPDVAAFNVIMDGGRAAAVLGPPGGGSEGEFRAALQALRGDLEA